MINDNVLVNNDAADNPVDMQLASYGDFFGVGIPLEANHDNLVVAGSHQGLTILDCGDDNRIVGQVTIVPCPWA